MSEELISLIEYAQLHGIEGATARQNALRGKYKTARKIGRIWVIDKNEPNIDGRITSGKYVGAKKAPKKDKKDE